MCILCGALDAMRKVLQLIQAGRQSEIGTRRENSMTTEEPHNIIKVQITWREYLASFSILVAGVCVLFALIWLLEFSFASAGIDTVQQTPMQNCCVICTDSP
jgi:hypothetical protein